MADRLRERCITACGGAVRARGLTAPAKPRIGAAEGKGARRERESDPLQPYTPPAGARKEGERENRFGDERTRDCVMCGVRVSCVCVCVCVPRSK